MSAQARVGAGVPGGRRSRAVAALVEHLEALDLVDHHVHGAFAAQPDRQQVRDALVEADTAPTPPGTDPFDSQVGFAVRRHCAPLLDLPAHAPAEDYLARREGLGRGEVDARLLRARAGVGTWLVDTGHGAGLVQTPQALASASGADAREVVRLESVAEELVADGGQDWARRFTAALHERAAAGAVGWKSVLAYRAGFDVDFSTPAPAALQAAADRWSDEVAGGRGGPAGPRLTDPLLLAAGILAAVEVSIEVSSPGPSGLAGLPLQLHVGFGDRDLDLRTVDPLLLRPLLLHPDVTRVPVMLLHCYPYERAAGYLAQAYTNVHLDVGLTVPFLGARAAPAVARSLELAPFAKVLYSSDAFGLPELHLLGARLWRDAAARVLGGFVDDGQWSLDDARRVATMVGATNAERVYRLDESEQDAPRRQAGPTRDGWPVTRRTAPRSEPCRRTWTTCAHGEVCSTASGRGGEHLHAVAEAVAAVEAHEALHRLALGPEDLEACGGDRLRSLLQLGDRADQQRRVRLLRGDERVVDAEVDLRGHRAPVTGERAEPTSTTAGQRRRLVDLLQAERVAVEAARDVLLVPRHRDLDVVQQHAHLLVSQRVLSPWPARS